MAVLNWFNKKRKQQFPQKRPSEQKQSKDTVRPVSDASIAPVIDGRAHHIIHGPHITEKSSLLASQGKYVFTVFPRANAHHVRRAVENMYGVHVIGVHMVTVPQKTKRKGRHTGIVTRMPRAVVTLKKGETLNYETS